VHPKMTERGLRRLAAALAEWGGDARASEEVEVPVSAGR